LRLRPALPRGLGLISGRNATAPSRLGITRGKSPRLRRRPISQRERGGGDRTDDGKYLPTILQKTNAHGAPVNLLFLQEIMVSVLGLSCAFRVIAGTDFI
jgi:hypothetical protein